MEQSKNNIQRNIRIIHFSSLPIWTIKNGSGMPTIIKCLEYYQKNNIKQKIVVFTQKQNFQNFNDIDYKNYYVFHDMFSQNKKIPYFIKTKLLIIAGFINIFKIYKEIKQFKPSIIYVHLPYLIWPVYLIAKRRNIPIFLRLYGTVTWINKLNKLINKILFPESYLFFKLNVCGYIFTNDGTASDLLAKKYGVNENKFLHLQNGVEINKVTKINAKNKIYKKFNLSKDDFVILFVSRLEKSKGIEYLPKLIKKTNEQKHVNWIIVGDGRMRTFLENSIKLFNNVHLIGAIDNKDLKYYYKSANLFISLNILSILNNPVLEALESEVPVIGLKRGINIEHIEEIAYLYNSFEEINKNINSMVNDDFKDFYLKISNWKKDFLYSWDKRYGEELIFIQKRIEKCGKKQV